MKAMLCALAIAACSPSVPVASGPSGKRPPPQAKLGAVTISIIGTNDLHGQLDRLPLLGGFLANLREVRAADGGGVLLVDAGDMFQGTLESNLAEGADVVKAYNELGYAAAAVGNHEFDFGPEGPAVTAQSIEDDPRGALKARAHEAKFPFLVSNIFDTKSQSRIKWPNMPASTLVTVAGVQIGIIGASTESTPYTTMPANFVGLSVAPPAKLIADEAAALRKQGAQIIVAVMHIGSKCTDLEHPTDLSTCDQHEELWKVTDALPHGAVDVIVAGHTHAAIAHRINDIAVIESYSQGRAFGRVDLRVSPAGHVTAAHITGPRVLCEGEKEGNPIPVAECKAGSYEGKQVLPDSKVQAIVDSADQRASKLRDEKLGVTLSKIVRKAYGSESAEGNLFCDLMLAARPDADVALTNGGGLRKDIPAGALTYGQLYEAMPFDNRFAVVTVQGSHLRRLVANNLRAGGGILSWGGLTATAKCSGSDLAVDVLVGGRRLEDAKTYKLVTSDFLASGGDGLIGRLKLPTGSIVLTDSIIRDAIADVLRKRKSLDVDALFAPPAIRRMAYDGERPVSCGPPAKKKAEEPE